MTLPMDDHPPLMRNTLEDALPVAAMRPNLFKYATSELSQDAVICWILAVADVHFRDSCPELHAFGQAFVRSLLSRSASCPQPQEVRRVRVVQQEANIDILCWINEEIVILIEDKVGTKQHSNQLHRYKNHLAKARDRIAHSVLIYLQTGDQCDYSPVTDADYHVLHRRDLIDLLGTESGRQGRLKSDILEDFACHLERIETLVQGYPVIPVKKWGKNARIGFLSRLKRDLDSGSWKYCPDQTGGHYGYFGDKVQVDGAAIYLRVVLSDRENKLFFKIDVSTPAEQVRLRDMWTSLIVGHACKLGLAVSKPRRKFDSSTMTVAIVGHPFPMTDPSGCLDLEQSLEIIRECQRVIDTCKREVVDAATGYHDRAARQHAGFVEA